MKYRLFFFAFLALSLLADSPKHLDAESAERQEKLQRQQLREEAAEYRAVADDHARMIKKFFSTLEEE
jgi:hypothetical protein